MLQIEVAFPNSCFGKDNALDSLIFGGGVGYCEIHVLICRYAHTYAYLLAYEASGLFLRYCVS